MQREVLTRFGIRHVHRNNNACLSCAICQHISWHPHHDAQRLPDFEAGVGDAQFDLSIRIRPEIDPLDRDEGACRSGGR